MNIIVLLSRTIDSEDPIKLENGQVAYKDANYIINPLDEIALEEAIKWKETYGGHITVLTSSSKEAEKQLRLALAIGADKAVLIEADDIKEEPYIIARRLAEYLKNTEKDIIIAGDFSTDGGSGQVGPRIAAILNIPFLTNSVKIEKEDGMAIVTRDTDDDIETYKGPFPVLITVPQGLNDPRLPTLAGIMKAKRKPLDKISSSTIISKEISSPVKTIEFYYPNRKRKNVTLNGDHSIQISQLANILQKFR